MARKGYQTVGHVSCYVQGLTFTRAGLLALALLSTWGGSSPQPAAVPLGPVTIEMRNVHLRAEVGIALDVFFLRG